jgi:hypothetical protein
MDGPTKDSIKQLTSAICDLSIVALSRAMMHEQQSAIVDNKRFADGNQIKKQTIQRLEAEDEQDRAGVTPESHKQKQRA